MPSIVRAIEYNLAIVVGRPIALVRRRRHVEAATGGIQEAAYSKDSVLLTAGDDRW
jgi:hypothetical protein